MHFVLPCNFLLLQFYLVYTIYCTVHFSLCTTYSTGAMCMYAHIVSDCCLSDESRSSWGMMMESVCCHGDHSITQNSKDNGMSKFKTDIPRHTWRIWPHIVNSNKNDHHQKRYSIIQEKSKFCGMQCVNTLHINRALTLLLDLQTFCFSKMLENFTKQPIFCKQCFSFVIFSH